jgi:hypothetical protein
MMQRFVLPAAAVAAAILALPATATVATFEDLGLGSNTNRENLTPGFTSGGASFANTWTDWGSYTGWNGFAQSSRTDTTTPGWTNQFSSFSGGGAGGSATYAVGYDDGWSPAVDLTITFAQDALVNGLHVNNTTYTALTIRDGDPGFGLLPFGQGDWYLLTLEGFDASSGSLGSLDFYLADYRPLIPAERYIIAEWTYIDLSSFGPTVRRLELTLDSSDVGPWGINTPTYVAVDNLDYTVPEPGAAGLLLGGLGGLWLFARRRAATRDSPD